MWRKMHNMFYLPCGSHKIFTSSSHYSRVNHRERSSPCSPPCHFPVQPQQCQGLTSSQCPPGTHSEDPHFHRRPWETLLSSAGRQDNERLRLPEHPYCRPGRSSSSPVRGRAQAVLPGVTWCPQGDRYHRSAFCSHSPLTELFQQHQGQAGESLPTCYRRCHTPCSSLTIVPRGGCCSTLPSSPAVCPSVCPLLSPTTLIPCPHLPLHTAGVRYSRCKG